MEIRDLSWNESLSKRFNHQLLPKSIRGLIVGKSGCGKTTLLLNLLLRHGWLDYNNLSVFGKSLFQPEYRILKQAFEAKLTKEAILKLFQLRDDMMRLEISPAYVVEEMGKAVKEKSDIDCNFFDSACDVPDPSNLNVNKKNLIIFDDLQLEKQNTCEKYYIRGRHSNVDCFYLAQNYFQLPRQTIRENSNFICLFPQDQKNINHIYNDHVSTDMSKEDFKCLCNTAWKEPHGFVVIDLSSKPDRGKYRSGLDTFYIK
jgi:energy-coupling factor transporter ATP-binding protein EcfA2